MGREKEPEMNADHLKREDKLGKKDVSQHGLMLLQRNLQQAQAS
jgi:hypothetical protein